MRTAYRTAMCSPDFLYHVEPAGSLDDHALACRLSYFLWRSVPDDELTRLADRGRLHDAGVLSAQAERLLKAPRSQRFVDDFLGQWLKLRQIAANDPDRKLYPEFSPYLQDSFVAESRAYFRELIDRDLGASYLVKSDFAMLNEKLAVHYGIPGVSGSRIRRVALPAGSPRGPFLTQGAILKVTANGTTTSPVPRGAFVMDRLLGRPPEPPPPNIPAIEPDVRGASTIREQLDRHRQSASCASCHARIDPPGFALEVFDVIGGGRTRYRSIGQGDPAPGARSTRSSASGSASARRWTRVGCCRTGGRSAGSPTCRTSSPPNRARCSTTWRGSSRRSPPAARFPSPIVMRLMRSSSAYSRAAGASGPSSSSLPPAGCWRPARASNGWIAHSGTIRPIRARRASDWIPGPTSPSTRWRVGLV